MQCENVTPRHRQFVGEHAGQPLGFGCDLRRIDVSSGPVVALPPVPAGLFPIARLDRRGAIGPDHDKLRERGLAVGIDRDRRVVEPGAFFAKRLDLGVKGFALLVVHIFGLEAVFDDFDLALDLVDAGLVDFAHRLTLKPRLRQILAVGPGRAFGEQWHDRADPGLFG